MRPLILSLLLGCAACTQAVVPATGPVPNPATPNGDVIARPDRAAPDTPRGVAPRPGFRDNAIDTDPASPRTRDTNQRLQAPSLSY